jgi:hypothetical protein
MYPSIFHFGSSKTHLLRPRPSVVMLISQAQHPPLLGHCQLSGVRCAVQSDFHRSVLAIARHACASKALGNVCICRSVLCGIQTSGRTHSWPHTAQPTCGSGSRSRKWKQNAHCHITLQLTNCFISPLTFQDGCMGNPQHPRGPAFYRHTREGDKSGKNLSSATGDERPCGKETWLSKQVSRYRAHFRRT